jgi:putative nucleotidyltransferase with HDIG domain
MISPSTVSGCIEQLAPLSPTASRLAAVVNDTSSTIDDIVGIVRYDQAVTAQILRWSNSAMSASAHPIVSVRDAVIRLGGARIAEYIIAQQVRGSLQAPLTAYGYCEKELWHHSVAAAAAAELSTTVQISCSAGVSFTAALLHDIGKLVLARVAPAAEMEKIPLLAASSGITHAEAEQKVLGCSHAGIGGEIASIWKLPSGITEAIRLHHSDTGAGPVTDMVRLANVIARSIGAGLGYEGMSVAVDNGIAARLGLSKEKIEGLCAATAFRVRQILELFE